MLVQISSGTGPVECGIAVGKVYAALVREFADPGCSEPDCNIAKGGHPSFPVLRAVPAKHSFGCKIPAYKSVLFSTDKNLGFLSGRSVCWQCPSPVRKGHRRKNWFVDVSTIPEVEEVPFDSKDLVMELFHAGGCATGPRASSPNPRRSGRSWPIARTPTRRCSPSSAR